MSIRARLSSLRPLLAFASLATVLGACNATGASSGTQKAERTVRTAERLSDQVTRLGGDLATLGTAIDTLRKSVGTEGILKRETVAKGDIAAAFKGYRKALETVRATAKKVDTTNSGLKSDLEAYLATWEENMEGVQNAKLREASMERRETSQKLFQKVSDEFTSQWQLFQTHLTGLNEIELALGSDLTPAGIDAIDGPLENAVSKGRMVQKGLSRASEVLREFAATLRAGAPAPAPGQ